MDDLEEELNDCILSLLSVPTVPNLGDGMEYETNEDKIQVDGPHVAIGKVDVVMQEFETTADDDSSQSELSTIQDDSSITETVSQASNVKSGPGKPQRYTEAEKEAMAIFMVDQGLTDGIVPFSYWVIFRKQVCTLLGILSRKADDPFQEFTGTT